MNNARAVSLAVVACCVVGVIAFIAVIRKPDPVRPGQASGTNVVNTAPANARVPSPNGNPRETTGAVVHAGAAGSSTNTGGTTNVLAARTEEQVRADAMRALLDAGDEKGALRMARELMGSKDVDVRAQVLVTLGWVGLRALPELTQMLADEDDGVASDAFTQWKMAYETIQEDDSRAEVLVAAMGSMRQQGDMEALVMSVGQLKAELAVSALVSIIQGENKVAGEVAREHYAFVTQSDYTTPEAAAQWIQKNAEPEEPEEAAQTAAP